MDKSLFAGFLTTLNTFSQSVEKSEIQGFSMGKSKFLILLANNLYFVARTDPSAKDGSVRKSLKEMVQIFFKHFPPNMFGKSWEAAMDLYTGLDGDFARFFQK